MTTEENEFNVGDTVYMRPIPASYIKVTITKKEATETLTLDGRIKKRIMYTMGSRNSVPRSSIGHTSEELHEQACKEIGDSWRREIEVEKIGYKAFLATQGEGK